jgi:hypothetical protein
MPPRNTKKTPDLENKILKALYALEKKDFYSSTAAARFFKICPRTLQRRRNGVVSQSKSSEMRQILTNAEEDTLVRWIKRYTITGAHITNSLLIELALQLRAARVTTASHLAPPITELDRINPKWIQRFQNRHPEIGGIYARQLEHIRKEGATYEHVERWFTAVGEKLEEHHYDPSNMYNMDESGFGIGEEQAIKVLVYLDCAQKHKVVGGKQEWVTAIECISAAGEALAPLLIFKGQDMNTRWINERSPKGWYFATSQNGWTSNDLGLAWLKTVFEPLTREKAAGRQRLLIADGHGSHIQGDFIAYCMENKIDLLIMPPHCSHILQPLDVGVFAAFKRFHTIETHAISRLSSQRIPRAEWIELLSRAREKAMSKENILSGWRGTGLWPALPMRVLRGLPKDSPIPAPQPITPCATTTLDLSLLQSSPPEAIELSRSNKRFTESLHECPAVVSPVKRYAERMTRLCETQNATIAIQAKQIADQAKLLQKRKKVSRGKRVRLEGVSVYTTAEVLRVAREEEARVEAKKPRGRPRKVIKIESSTEEEDEVSEDSLDSFNEAPVKRRRGAVFSHVEV